MRTAFSQISLKLNNETSTQSSIFFIRCLKRHLQHQVFSSHFLFSNIQKYLKICDNYFFFAILYKKFPSENVQNSRFFKRTKSQILLHFIHFHLLAT